MGVIRTFIRGEGQSAWMRTPVQEWDERIFRRNEGIKLAGP